MNTGKRVTERSVLVLGVLLILQLVFILTKSYTSMAWIIVYFTLQNMILIAACTWLNPIYITGVGFLLPIVGYFTGLYPSMMFAINVALGNAILIIINMSFERRSILVGIVLAALIQFAYYWLMVVRIMPMLITDAASLPAIEFMQQMFDWKQLVAALVGGFLSTFPRFRILLRREMHQMELEEEPESSIASNAQSQQQLDTK